MRLRDDSGLSLAELIVVMALMSIVIAAAYMAFDFSYKSRDVSDRQSHIAREIASPIRVMDQSFSQSVVPAFGTAIEPYHVRVRMPADFIAGRTIEHDYAATTDGRLVQTVYRVSGTTSTVVRTVTWSDTNRNRAVAVPLFTYYSGSVVTTNVIDADSVSIEVCSDYEGRVYRDKRRVAFRNR